MMPCLVYNTPDEPIELVPSLIGLRLHLVGKAVILETVPGQVARRLAHEFALVSRVKPWVPSRGDLMIRRLAPHATVAA